MEVLGVDEARQELVCLELEEQLKAYAPAELQYRPETQSVIVRFADEDAADEFTSALQSIDVDGQSYAVRKLRQEFPHTAELLDVTSPDFVMLYLEEVIGPIVNCVHFPDENRLVVAFETAEALEKLHAQESYQIDKDFMVRVKQEPRFQRSRVHRRALHGKLRGTVFEPTRAVIITGIPATQSKSSVELKLTKQWKRIGIEYSHVDWNPSAGSAVISFPAAIDASKSIQLGSKAGEWSVKPCPGCHSVADLLGDVALHIEDISLETSKEALWCWARLAVGDFAHTIIYSASFTEAALLFTYFSDLNLEEAQGFATSHKMDKRRLRVTAIRRTTRAQAGNLPARITEATLKQHLEDGRVKGRKGGVARVEMLGQGMAVITFADDKALQQAIAQKHVLNNKDLWIVPLYDEIGPVGSYQQVCSFVDLRTAILQADAATSIPPELIVTGFGGKLDEPPLHLHKFLSQRKMSGGGEVLSFSCNESTAVVTFVDPETASRIYQKYQLEGLQLCDCRLTLSLRLFETADDAYKNQVLLRNVGVASEDSLRYFLWCICGTPIDRLEFVRKDRESHLCVIAHFKADIDFRRVAGCMKAAVLDGLSIEVDQVMMPRSILAKNVPEHAHRDLVELCFRSRFDVQDLYQVSSQDWVVAFQQSKDAVRACQERVRFADRVELQLSMHSEFRPDPSAREKGRRGSHSVVLDSVDRSVVDFASSKRRAELEGLLKQAGCTLSIDGNSGRPVVVSVLGPADPAYRDLVLHWPRIQADILAFFGQFQSKSVTVLPSVYDSLVASEAFRKLSGKDCTDLAVTELRSESRGSEMKELSLAGMPQAVQWASDQLAAIVKDISDAMERQKLRTAHTMDRLADWQLKLLGSLGFRKDMCSRFADVDVVLDDERKLVRFEGLPGDVKAMLDEMNRLLKDSCEETVKGSGTMVALLGRERVRAVIDDKLKESKLAGCVVWCTKPSTGVSVHGVDSRSAHDAAAIFRSHVVDKLIPLDADAHALVSTDKWRTTVEAIVKKCNGDLVIENVGGGNDGATVQLSCLTADADRVVEEVQEFLRRHTMKKDFVRIPQITMKFLLKFMRGEIEQIETAQTRNFVKVHQTDETAVGRDAEKSGFHIEGNGDGIINAKRMLATIMKKHKVATKKHELCVPGAELHFKSRDSILVSIGDSTETVMGLAMHTDDNDADLGLRLDESGLLSATQLMLPGGTELQVMKGDITGLQCDAIVNPANVGLQHYGGLARIIADKGGQTITDECTAFIREHGQLNEGQACITGAGSLPCKKVIHAVGPKWQGGTRSEANKLFTAVQNLLAAASQHGLGSIALPPISSGVFGYPLEKCTKEIVESVISFCGSASKPLKKIILVDNKDDGVKYFKQAVDQQLAKDTARNPRAVQAPELKHAALLSAPRMSMQPAPRSIDVTDQSTRPSLKPVTVGSTLLELVEGSLLDEQVDVLVNTVGKQLLLDQGALSGIVSRAAGPQMQQYVTQNYPNGLAAGQIAISPGFALQCRIVLHSCCTAWNGGTGEQVLNSLLTLCLKETAQRGHSSIAIPAMGTGVLRFPPKDAARITYRALLDYCQQHPSSSIRCIKLVVFDSPVVAAFQEQHSTLTNNQNGPMGLPKTPAPSSGRGVMSTDTARTRVQIGQLSVQIVEGNLSHEKVDIIVNSTDSQLSLGGQVSRSLVAEGGPTIETECQQKGSIADEGVFLARPGSLKCRHLLHVDSGMPVKQIIMRSLEKAIEVKAKSISFPAICTGVKMADPTKMAHALIKAITAFAESRDCKSLHQVRFVIFERNMVECFVRSLRLPLGAESSDMQAISAAESSPRVNQTSDASLRSSHAPAFSVTLNICGKEENIAKAINAVEDYCRKNIAEYTDLMEELGSLLSDDQVDDFIQHGLAEGVAVKVDKSSGRITVASMDRMAVQAVRQHVMITLNGNQFNRLRQEAISSRFQWQYMNDKQEWCDYEARLNVNLETAHKSGKPTIRYQGSDGISYIVNLALMKDHKESSSGDATDVQRVDKDLGLPKFWDAVSSYHEVVLLPTSGEYARVKDAFVLTAGATRLGTLTIIEIRRIQNPTLLKQYFLQLRKVTEGMQPGSALPAERWLWHGTAEDSLKKICSHGFNRSYCGKNAVMFGQGVYFARDAAYSAQPTYSVPNAAGHKCMIYSQVVTGEFHIGTPHYRVPNPKPHNTSLTYDTTVDDVNNPSIFVIYHDAQAYPAYVVKFQ